jgi:hypothetical protein
MGMIIITVALTVLAWKLFTNSDLDQTLEC